MKILLILPFLLALINRQTLDQNNNTCSRRIKQPNKGDQFKVYEYYGGYVVGQYEKTAVPDSTGYIDTNNPVYKNVFVMLVYDQAIFAYYPWPENQLGRYITIREKDSCKAKEHWFKYEKQWKSN